jgi:hypothetical protein
MQNQALLNLNKAFLVLLSLPAFYNFLHLMPSGLNKRQSNKNTSSSARGRFKLSLRFAIGFARCKIIEKSAPGKSAVERWNSFVSRKSAIQLELANFAAFGVITGPQRQECVDNIRLEAASLNGPSQLAH